METSKICDICYYDVGWWLVAVHVVEFILLAICIRNAFDTFICVCVFYFHFFSFLFKYNYQTENQHKFVYPGFGQLPGQRFRDKSTAEWENMSSHSITTVRTLFRLTHSFSVSLWHTNKHWNHQTRHVTMEQHLVTIMQECVAGKTKRRTDTFKLSLQ